ncbi:MAG: DNA mismatch repair endonuclease MutL [Deltaproteobacteria bacterium]|nr:DNA mismatch repair endonuclease MutL [Deltaproteobacteria bacterium]
MPKIKVLHKVVADQIAAGEVVERPASVVKELIENSIDAGADQITLEIDGGGVGRIRVLDNGAGFDSDDVELAFLRHATSKITNIEDLNAIRSFGFRGEALASIASVAKVTVHTRVKDAVAGTRVRIEGGELLDKRDAASPVGCDFEVRELFYNVPARLKFLKKESTESSHCIEALVRMALVRPDVSFKVMSNGRKVRELVKVNDDTERVKALFSTEALAMTEGEEFGVKVRAVLGAPEKARAGAASLYTYVNGRYIRDRALLRAVTQAFGHTLESGRYPVGFIALDVPPNAFDVNVHPQKTEVRFANPQSVFRAVSHVVGAMAARSPWAHAVSEKVTSYGSGVRGDANSATHNPSSGNAVREASVDYGRPTQASFPSPPTSGFSGMRPGVFEERTTPANRESDTPGIMAGPLPQSSMVKNHDVFQALPNSIPKEVPDVAAIFASDDEPRGFSALRFVGQARNMFLVMEDEADLVIIDQHAAHERVTYERLRRELAQGRIASQRLLTPHMIDLGPAETERIIEKKDALSRLGLEVEQAGADRIAVYGVPPEISASPERLLAELVLALEEGREGAKGEMEDKAVATLACHSSIRAGRSMKVLEVEALLAQMDKVDFAGHCPHGRPVLARIPFAEIRRRVHRE